MRPRKRRKAADVGIEFFAALEDKPGGVGKLRTEHIYLDDPVLQMPNEHVNLFILFYVGIWHVPHLLDGIS